MPNFKRKIEKLDDAFLFLLGFIGLVVTIIQVYFFEASLTGLLETIPLLFLGIVMPFYVGYVRGAISIDVANHSLVERMRGWVYLIIGVSAYVGHVLAMRVPYWILGISVPYYFSLAVSLVSAYFLLKSVINVFQPEFRSNISHEYALSGTIVSAVFFPFFLRMIVSIYSALQQTFQYTSLLMFFVWFTLTIIWMCFVFEKVSRNIINANLPLNATQIEKRQQRGVLFRFFIYIGDIYSFALRTSLKSTFLWIQGLLIGLLGLLLILLRIPIYSDAYLLTSIILQFLGTVYFLKLRIDFSQLGTR